MPPRAVLHFMWSGDVGGAPRAIYQLVRSQLESGDSPGVAFGAARGEYFDRIRRLGCDVMDMQLDRDWRIWNAERVRPLLERFPFHHFHSPEITLGLASVRSRDATRIYTHRAGVAEYRGRRRQRYRLFGRYLRRSFQGVSGNTLQAITAGASLFEIPSDRWHLTYNGVYFDELEPERPRASVAREIGLDLKHSWVIATSGSLRDSKRVDRILSAAANSGRANHRVLIIGDGPARRGLEELARRLGIGDTVIITGIKERIGDYLQLADVFVLPSSSAESFGNAAVEAMALGIPTIVFEDGGGLREHIVDGRTGLIVGGVSELAQALVGLQDDPGSGRRLGDQGRTFVRSNYTPARMLEAYDQLYENAEVTMRSGRSLLDG